MQLFRRPPGQTSVRQLLVDQGDIARQYGGGASISSIAFSLDESRLGARPPARPFTCPYPPAHPPLTVRPPSSAVALTVATPDNDELSALFVYDVDAHGRVRAVEEGRIRPVSAAQWDHRAESLFYTSVDQLLRPHAVRAGLQGLCAGGGTNPQRRLSRRALCPA